MSAPDGPAAPVAARLPADDKDIGDSTLPESTRPPIEQVRGLLVALVAGAALYTCAIASEMLLPIFIAAFTAVFLNPIANRLSGRYFPKWIAAILVVLAVITAIGSFLWVVYEPAVEWAAEVPKAARSLAPQLSEMTKPIEQARQATEQIADMTSSGETKALKVVNAKPTPIEKLLEGGPRTLAGILASLILIYFFLVYGEVLLRRGVTLFPNLHQKRVTVEIVRSIQSEMSRYMLTITLINLALGIVTALVFWWLGLELTDALLWGAVAGLVNYAPYVGPLAGTVLFLLVGVVEFDSLGQALALPGAFLLLHLIEGQFVTPTILGRSMALNPVIIIVWLIFWGWLWGIAGLLLAVPMLVCFKIIASRVDALHGWAVMLEG